MRPLPRLRLVPALVCALALVLAGCGGGDDPVPEPTDVATGLDVGVPSEAADDPIAPAPRTEDAAASSPGTPTEGATDGAAAEPIGPLSPSEPFGLTELTLASPEGETVAVPAYVAAEPSARQRGLMHREDLPAGTGMVFLFPEDNTGGFWMANTLIPLSIAFYDASGTVVSVLDMEPCTEEDLNDCPSYDPEVAYRGALEVNQGFFDEIGLTEGWTVEVPEGVADPT